MSGGGGGRRWALLGAAALCTLGLGALVASSFVGASADGAELLLWFAGAVALLGGLLSLVYAARAEGGDARRRRFWSRHAPALVVSLLATPLLVAMLGVALIWLPLVGLALIFSTLLGAPSFFLVGGPVAWAALRRWYRPDRSLWALGLGLGLLANLAAGALAIPTLALLGDETPIDTALSIHLFGLIGGPLYGVITAQLYGLMRGPAERRAATLNGSPDAAPPA